VSVYEGYFMNGLRDGVGTFTSYEVLV
jgi:hypothetical protein